MSTYLVQVTVDTLEQLRELEELNLDLQCHVAQQVGAGHYAVFGILDDNQIQRLLTMRYRLELVADLAITGASQRQETLEALQSVEEGDKASAEDRVVTTMKSLTRADQTEVGRRIKPEERDTGAS